MTASRIHSSEDLQTRLRPSGYEPAHIATDSACDSGTLPVGYSAALLRHRSINRHSNSETHEAAMHASQRIHGNRAVQRYVHGSNTRYLRPSLPVQREEGGMWDYAKNLLGVDQIGPGIEQIVGKAKSGYNWAEKQVLDLFKPDGDSPAPASEGVPGDAYGGVGSLALPFHAIDYSYMPYSDHEF